MLSQSLAVIQTAHEVILVAVVTIIVISAILRVVVEEVRDVVRLSRAR
jgi:hypothetical protein